jgi:hypothetical protein
MGGSMKKRKRITLEPDLEADVAFLNAYQRRALARKFERWAHQLRLSATILLAEQKPKPKPSLKAVSPRRLRLN